MGCITKPDFSRIFLHSECSITCYKFFKDDSQFQWPLLPKMIWETDKYQIEKEKREVTMVPE